MQSRRFAGLLSNHASQQTNLSALLAPPVEARYVGLLGWHAGAGTARNCCANWFLYRYCRTGGHQVFSFNHLVLWLLERGGHAPFHNLLCVLMAPNTIGRQHQSSMNAPEQRRQRCPAPQRRGKDLTKATG